MNRTLKQAAAALGIRERQLRQALRDRRILLADGTLAAPYVGQGQLFMHPRRRWDEHKGRYVHYAVIMVTESGIDWLAGLLGIQVTTTKDREHAA